VNAEGVEEEKRFHRKIRRSEDLGSRESSDLLIFL
jgi:hypothetical protein